MLKQLTKDHSVINDVIEQRPDIEEEMLARLPRNAVTRALGVDEQIGEAEGILTDLLA